MKFDDANIDTSQLEDRRGMGRGGMMGAGAGGLGIIGIILFLLLGGNLGGSGIDPTSLGLDPGSGGGGSANQGAPSAQQLAAKCSEEGAFDNYDDCFVLKVFNETNEVWAGEVNGYTEPKLVFFNNGVATGCGQASSQAGPFYCPPDRKVYIDLDFLNQLQRQLGAQGRNAQAYVVAHEVGHHLQTLFGTEAKVRAAQQRNPRQQNALSVRMELQADCYAGVWARNANDKGNVVITQEEFNEAMRAAAAVGDDRIMEGAGMRVDPEKFTHGTAQQRQQWFNTGYQSGDLNQCDTFSS